MKKNEKEKKKRYIKPPPIPQKGTPMGVVPNKGKPYVKQSYISRKIEQSYKTYIKSHRLLICTQVSPTIARTPTSLM
jgi:hypothetical protein